MNNDIIPNADDSIEKMSEIAKVSFLKRLSRFFSIDLTIKIFGQTIYELHYPPLSERKS